MTLAMGASADALSGLLADLQKTILKALEEMTTEKWPSSEEWVIWWGKRKTTFEFAKDKK